MKLRARGVVPCWLLAILGSACLDQEAVGTAEQAETSAGTVTACGAISAANCLDWNFPDTRCGQTPGAKAICASLCAANPAPTQSQCEDPHWLGSACGRIEAARWSDALQKLNPSLSTCASLKAEIIGRGGIVPTGRFDGVPTDRLVPEEMHMGDGTTLTSPPRTHDTALVVPFTNPRMFHAGGTGLYAGWREHEAVRASSANPQMNLSEAVRVRAMKQGWEANGNRVGSCKEYVFEKYYNYSKYQDAVEAAGANFRAYVDAAFSAPMTFSLPPSLGNPLDLIGVEDAQQRLTTSRRVLIDVANPTVPVPDGTVGPSIRPVTQVQKLSRTGTAQLSVYPASAIGSLGEIGVPIKARDGTTVQKQIELATDPRHKNIFFEMPVARHGDSFEHVLSDNGMVLDRCGSATTGINLCDRDLISRLVHGYPILETRGWAYHRQKSAALQAAGFTDEDLYLADDLKERYQSLLDEHLAVVHEIGAQLESAKAQGLVAADLEIPGIPTDAYQGHAIEQSLMMAARSSIGGMISAQTAPAAISTFLSSSSGSYGSVPQPASSTTIQVDTHSPLAAVFPHAAQSYGAVESGGTVVNGVVLPPITKLSDLDRLRIKLAGVDHRIEEALLEARDLGCLELGPANPCDWSPREFAQQVADFYEPEQEADFARCLKMTQALGFDTLAQGRLISRPAPVGSGTVVALPAGAPKIRAVVSGSTMIPLVQSGFTTAACYLSPAGDLYPDPVPNTGDGLRTAVGDLPFQPGANVWSRSTSRLDTYFQCLEQYGKLILATVEDKVGDILDENGKPKVGNSKADSEVRGNDDWNMHMSYGFGWSAGKFDEYVAANAPSGTNNQPPPNPACLLKPEAYGQIAFGATALGHAFEIFSASGHGRTGAESIADIAQKVTPDRIKVDLEVLGHSILHVDESTQAGGTFHPITDEKSDEKDFISVTVPFALGPIPMSLSGGVTGRIGVQYGLTQLGDPAQCETQGIEAYFSPFAGVDGFAAVGLDVGLAAAGVKIALTIVEASLPFTASVRLKPVDNQLGIAMDTNLKLSLSTLGGRFAVYLRILLWTAEWTLFSWEGFHHDVTLFSTELDVPLEPLATATSALLGQGN